MMVQDTKILGSHPIAASIFLREGRAPEFGETLRQPNLARALERIADGGSEEFYRGDLANEMVTYARENGGLFEAKDFAAHTSDVVPPLKISYRGFSIFTEPPVSPGIVTLLVLRILERFDMAKYDPQSPERFHILLEAIKLAFEDRATLGDPRWVENNLDEKLSDEHADRQAARIDLKRAQPSPSLPPASPGTESAVFADAEGNVVAYIQSVDHSCGVILGETGVLMNGRMPSFSLDPASPNVVAPGKRPIHTLTNYIVHDRDGNFAYAGGTPGGNFQPQINLQILTNVIDYGMTVTEAVYAPRFTLGETRIMTDPIVRIENRMPASVADGLERLGHRVQVVGPWDNPGAVQIIARNPRTGMYAGATEPRRSDCIVSGF
jgi:gamma-glutamyltranspeptidase/glutathione hydrolase